MHDADDRAAKAERIVAARLKLRERFLARERETPSLSDRKPQGSGPLNRHGMPRLPPDQTATAEGRWPVLDLGSQPSIEPGAWRLRVHGTCAREVELDLAALRELGEVEDTSDFHCVTGWSKLDVRWRGVRLLSVLALAEPGEEARFLRTHAADGYTTNLPLAEALKDDVLLAYEAEESPLAPEHGGPVRMITPQLWAWKGAKWIDAIEILVEDRPGFWERRGYSNTAYPWRNDRYAS